MKQSETLSKLFEALAKAQGEMENSSKDKDNPFFKSKYADLGSVWDAIRACLSKNGLCVTQPWETVEGKHVLTTILAHSSGEFISTEVMVKPVKEDPQGIGSALTYYKRFALSAIVGNAPSEKPTEDDVDDSDDDGNVASGKVIQPVISKWQMTEFHVLNITSLCKAIGFGQKAFLNWCNGAFHTIDFKSMDDIKSLSESEYSTVLSNLKALADRKAEKEQPDEKKIEVSQEFEEAVAGTGDPRNMGLK